MGAEPPICQIDYYCGNQKVGSEDKFELNSYDPDNCILIYKCENEIKQITGTPGSTIIRDGETNECWEFQFCEFDQNSRKVKRIRGNPTKIEPCYENSKVPPTTFSWEDVKEYWDLIFNKWKSDEDGCIYYKEYECTGCPGGKHLERLGASKIKTYCLDQNGVCRKPLNVASGQALLWINGTRSKLIIRIFLSTLPIVPTNQSVMCSSRRIRQKLFTTKMKINITY